jgi:hypothetical protein
VQQIENFAELDVFADVIFWKIVYTGDFLLLVTRTQRPKTLKLRIVKR